GQGGAGFAGRQAGAFGLLPGRGEALLGSAEHLVGPALVGLEPRDALLSLVLLLIEAGNIFANAANLGADELGALPEPGYILRVALGLCLERDDGLLQPGNL